MNIQEFVCETLVQITNGVVQAQRQLDKSGAVVNPHMRVISKEHSIGQAEMRAGDVVGLVVFDVAVHATEGKESKGGIGVLAGAITLGSAGKSDSSSGSESRIRFSVPLLLPVHGMK
jgi:hypothetical protein